MKIAFLALVGAILRPSRFYHWIFGYKHFSKNILQNCSFHTDTQSLQLHEGGFDDYYLHK
jgi:hypothetical protein